LAQAASEASPSLPTAMAGWKLEDLPPVPPLPVASVDKRQLLFDARPPQAVPVDKRQLVVQPAAASSTRPAALKRKEPGTAPAAAAASADKDSTKRQQQQRFEERLARGDAADPVQLWCDYAAWTAEHWPTKHASVLSRACHSLASTPTHKGDVRHLRLWVSYASTSEQPQKVFGFLHEHHIGIQHALLYEAWALACEKGHRFFAASEAYRRGIERGAHPLAKLKQSHVDFEKRMKKREMRRKAAASSEQAAAHADAGNSGALGSSAQRAEAAVPPTSAAAPPPSMRSWADGRGLPPLPQQEPLPAERPGELAAESRKRGPTVLEEQPSAPMPQRAPHAEEAKPKGDKASAEATAKSDAGVEPAPSGKRRRLMGWVATPFSRFWAGRPAPAAADMQGKEHAERKEDAARLQEEDAAVSRSECWSAGLEALGQVLLEEGRSADSAAPVEVEQLAPAAAAPRLGPRWMSFLSRA